jgi:hypothetical protein
MQVADLNNPGERKKLIWAGLLGLVAIVFLWWTFIGFGGSSKPATTTPSSAVSPVTQRFGQTVRVPQKESTSGLEGVVDEIKPINWPVSIPDVPEAKRNIFAYYEPPSQTTEGAATPAPTPTPTPPVLLATVSPSNVYARTADFTLDVAGDKFSPQLHIYVDGRDLATKYRSPQQLTATVPAAMIANPGARQIEVRSADGRIYSNSVSLSVAQPPTPNYAYVGIIGPTTHIDIALLQDRNSKEILNAQRGDVLSGRFRLTSISEKEVVLVDTNLKIKHTLTMMEGDKSAGPLARPTPNVAAEDDEP